MSTVADVLAAAGHGALRHVSGEARSRSVRDVFIVENAAEIGDLPRDAFVILSAEVSRRARGCLLDVVTRSAAAAGVAALTLTGPGADDFSASAQRVAHRCRMSLLIAAPQLRPCVLLRRVLRAFGGGADLALARAVTAVRALSEADLPVMTPEAVCAAAAGALGLPIERRAPSAGEIGARVVVDGRVEGVLAVPQAVGPMGEAARIVVQATADALARAAGVRRRKADAPGRARTRLVSELLVTPTQHAAEALARARVLGLPVDGWHLVVRLDVDAGDRDETARFELLDAVGAAALRVARAVDGDGWCLGYVAHTPHLVRMWTRDPGPGAVQAVRRVVGCVLEGVRATHPGPTIRCGLGGLHQGPSGLRVSRVEARAALSPPEVPAHAASGEPGPLRMLLDWYGSEAARACVRNLLAPLDRLGSDKAETAVQTLRAYLDNQGSLVATAAALRLHRDAVAYRLKRVLAVLDVDVTDPEQRLALQLACRAWNFR